MKIAILSPSLSEYSETFIKAHFDFLEGEKQIFYGSSIPQKVSGKNTDTILSLGARMKRKLVASEFTIAEEILLKNLQEFSPDVILAEYGTTAAASIRVIKNIAIPLVIHFHGFDAYQYQTLEKFKKEYSEMFHYAKSVIAVSSRMKTQLTSIGCPEQKIRINTYGPNTDFFGIQPDIHSKNIIYVGRFTDKKAPYYTLLTFMEVLKEVPDARLIMVGEGILKESVVNLSKYFGVDHRIEFTGALGHEQVIEKFKSATVYTQHSITAASGDSEGTPVAILEASAASLPVVSTDHAGIPEVIIHEKSGFILKEHDVKGISERIVFLLKHPDVAAEMGRQGRKFVESQYSMEKHINELNTILKSAAH